ncbi:MAG: E22 family MetX-like putative esterase [Candidatus Wenzhouxiangella sp. M2_3B_020]
MKSHRVASIAAVLALALSWAAEAESLVEKNTFVTENFTTLGGETIPEVRIGWEAYGKPNADRSNVILVAHHFSGTSHAAGRYAPDDADPGYWDAIIGPGKAIDTDRFYVISSDTLVNANVHDEHVVTTGPASIDPRTGRRYGLDFPVVTIRDFVEVQRRLLDSLGIEKLHAVVGASMGSLQALEWAVTHPERVERMISVIGAGRMRPWEVAVLETWAWPIRLDPAWNGGDYYQGPRPLDGLAATMAMVTQQALHPDFFDARFGDHDPLAPPVLESVNRRFEVTDWLLERGRERARRMDANHVLYLIRASQTFLAGHGDDLARALSRVRAESLFLPAAGDLLLRPELAREAHEILLRQGRSSTIEYIDGVTGHLDGLTAIDGHAATMAAFLAD